MNWSLLSQAMGDGDLQQLKDWLELGIAGVMLGALVVVLKFLTGERAARKEELEGISRIHAEASAQAVVQQASAYERLFISSQSAIDNYREDVKLIVTDFRNDLRHERDLRSKEIEKERDLRHELRNDISKIAHRIDLLKLKNDQLEREVHSEPVHTGTTGDEG